MRRGAAWMSSREGSSRGDQYISRIRLAGVFILCSEGIHQFECQDTVQGAAYYITINNDV